MDTVTTYIRSRLSTATVSPRNPVVVGLGAVVVAAAVGLALAAVAGANPATVIEALVDGTLGSPFAVGTSMNSAAVLMLVAIGFTIAYRAGLVNVGGEGQICLGGVAATAVGVSLPEGIPPVLAIPLTLAAAVLGGALWASIAAWLKVRRGASEIITTLLLNFVGLAMVVLMVHEEGLLRQPVTSSETLPQSESLGESTHLPLLGLAKNPATIAIVLAIGLAVLVAVLLRHSAVGIRLRAVGLSPSAAARLGVPIERTAFLGLTTAGGCAGLAGGLLVTSAPFVLAEGFSSGFGFSGLVVGLLARGSMIAVAGVSLLFGFLVSGGINLQLQAGVPSSTITVVQSVLIILIAATAWWASTSPTRSRNVAATKAADSTTATEEVSA
ncbi:MULTISPECIES: ABC transporter permease [Gordonia]|uniref:ABC transporter permease n=1 Tax=Gordonia TaxID=2053 RepID=UPI0010F77489|nr:MULTISPECIES: ABC transporter permease [unclassified Gordonia (in: high G+C Gram-positive bacteria)]MCT1354108.1 ABC transporter permease [Gordonia sp. p3-SID1431]